MKLTKEKLLVEITDDLTELGYKELKDTLTGANGLFVKKVKNEFVLTLGLIISRYHDSMFTGSYYLSKSTRWSSIWDTIPDESYQRVGNFLNNEERKTLLDKDHSQPGVVDSWWDGLTRESIDHFIETVRITEKRFLEQPSLFEKIESSPDVIEFVEHANKVIHKVKIVETAGYDYKFTPQRSIDDIPINWFKAAEIVLAETKAIVNANTVKLLAADAWRKSSIV